MTCKPLGKVLRFVVCPLLAVSLSLLAVRNILEMETREMEVITILHPYRAFFPLDPRRLFSVGDQVLCEHMFAFHGAQSPRGGFHDSISMVSFDTLSNVVEVRPKFPVVTQDGRTLSINQLCESLKSSFDGTQHGPFDSKSKKEFLCLDDLIRIKLNKLPSNLPALFTIPDFAIFESERLPIVGDVTVPTTGPYSFERKVGEDVYLLINPNFPDQLRANRVKRVLYRPYKLDGHFLEKLNPREDNLIYLHGVHASKEVLELLKRKGYRIQIYPSEWLLYVGFGSNAGRELRAVLTSVVDEARPTLLENFDHATEALSIAPADRPFSVSPKLYTKIRSIKKMASKPGRIFKLGVHESEADKPLIKRLVEVLRNGVNFEVHYYPGAEYRKMLSQSDAYITMLGISPGDPLSHLSYLRSTSEDFAQDISEAEIRKVSEISNSDHFISAVRELESKVITNMLVVPVAHFPGVVAEAPNFERVESIAGSWGTQAWTYRIR